MPTWGYSMFYYLAASNDCHPNYVTYLMEKRTLSVKSINELLGKLEGEAKLLYDKNYIERLYLDYQSNEINDEADRAALKEVLSARPLLLIGPGASIDVDKRAISSYIKKNNPIIVTINFVPKVVNVDYIFLSNAKRYLQLATKLARKKYDIIATSNVTPTTTGAFAYQINYSSLVDMKAEIIDNSLVMLLKLLMDLDISEVTLAGFDGYSKNEANFATESMEYDFIRKKARKLNKYTTDFLASIKDRMQVTFLTKSHYEEK